MGIFLHPMLRISANCSLSFFMPSSTLESHCGIHTHTLDMAEHTYYLDCTLQARQGRGSGADLGGGWL